MARPIQVSGDGWVADRPISDLGRTPKQLLGKIVKTSHDRQYKRGLSYALCREQQSKGERRRKRRKKGSER